MLIFLQTLTRAIYHFQPVVNLLFDLGSHVGISHLDTVDDSLMLKELLHSNLLGDGTVGIACPLHTLHSGLHTHRLYLGLQDGLITDHPDHLVDDSTDGGALSHGIGISLNRQGYRGRTAEGTGRGHAHQGNGNNHCRYDFLDHAH